MVRRRPNTKFKGLKMVPSWMPCRVGWNSPREPKKFKPMSMDERIRRRMK